MSIFRYRCKLNEKDCNFSMEAKRREDIEAHIRAHAERFHDMNNAKNLTDLVNRTLEEMSDYSD